MKDWDKSGVQISTDTIYNINSNGKTTMILFVGFAQYIYILTHYQCCINQFMLFIGS